MSANQQSVAETTSREPERWCIGGMVFDPSLDTIVHGARPVRLRPKTSAVLRHLARHAGRLVRRDELLDVVWPGVFVTDDSLTQCVSELRRALKPDLADALRTVPRRGYLLAAPVRLIDPMPPCSLSGVEELLAALEARIACLERLALRAGAPDGIVPPDAAAAAWNAAEATKRRVVLVQPAAGGTANDAFPRTARLRA